MKPQIKKRGRKPKGGQITKNNISNLKKEPECKQNIILHLKINTKHNTIPAIDPYSYYSKKSDIKNISDTKFKPEEEDESNLSIDDKLKSLQLSLHNNNITKRSACFWCTYTFTSTAIYIPKNSINNKYNVYGCFCSPQCAAAYLFNEIIEESIKLNRYSMLNFLYTPIFNYKHNIIPAPNPHYLLNKFYGNMTIKEYRELIKANENHILLINKPISKVFPELHNEHTTKPDNNYKKYHNGLET